MPNLGGMTGTPWHVENMTRAEGDPRRHRSRCVYYIKDGTYCSKLGFRCFGSAHCEYYKGNPAQIKKPIETGLLGEIVV